MAVLGHFDEAALRYLKALGMPDDCVKFTVISEFDAPLMAEAVFYVTPDSDETITKRFVLHEVEDEIQDRPAQEEDQPNALSGA